MESVTDTPTTETVEQYVSIFQNLDIETGVKGLLTLAIGLLLARLVLSLVKKVLKRSQIPPTTHTILCTLVRIMLDMMAILSAANVIGIPITSFVTLLGVAGLAISLAVQGLLSNLASGFIILTGRPFEVGHFVENGGVTGTVREIRMLHTRLETPDGKMIYIPNSTLAGSQISNFSETGRRRVEIQVSASYRNSPDQVRAAAKAAVEGTEGVLREPAPEVFLAGYGDSAIQYTLWLWVGSADFLRVRNEVTEKLYQTFAEQGVEMTYPHLNIHMVNGDVPQ